MTTYVNPNAIKEHSVTSAHLADGVIPTDASIAAMGYTKNQGTITGITMNGESQGTAGVVNLGTVVTDVSNLAPKSDAIASLSLSMNSTNYQITLSGTKVDGTAFTVQDTIDLPIESVVVSGAYDNNTKKVVLTLKNGTTIDFSVADLVAGLQTEITSSNKLSADLISDGNTNKTVTATEKSTWNGKQDAISDLATIRANASEGAAKVSNVQADWNATTGLSVILNKPTDLQSEITSTNKLSADLIQDGTTNKTVTQTEKNNWNDAVHKSGEETITGKKIFDNADLVMKNGSTNGVITTPSIYFQLGTNSDTRADWKISAKSSDAASLTDYISIDKVQGSSTSNIIKINDYYTETNYILINKLYDSTSLPISLETDSGYTEGNETYGTLYLSSGNDHALTHDVVIDGIKTPNDPSTRYDYTAANRKYVDDAVSNVNVLPAVTASDNGKVLMVVNGVWTLITPVSIYSGSEAPNNSQGVNGDIYLQV